MKVTTTPSKTNPVQSKGMEVFFQSPTLTKKEEEKIKGNPGGEKMKVSNQDIKPSSEEIKAESKQMAKNIINDVEEKIEELEKSLKNVRELELTAFNQIVYSKKLMFKLLFIKSRIYVIVKNPQEVNKSTIISIAPPRWGGSSLRYMIMNCSLDWCTVISKSTTKGNILSYKSMSMSDGNEEVDDIFS
jgi:hypothetical protein